MAKPNQPTIINGQLTFVGAIAGQVSVQAQPIAGNNLLFNLPNTVPNPNAVISVLSVVGSTVTLGFAPPAPQSFSFSQITGTVATSQLANVEGTGSKVQTTNAGVTVSGDVVTYDGSGNIQDSGVSLALLLAGAAPSPVTPHLGSAAQYALLGTTITNSDGAGTVISGGNISGTTITPAGWTLTPPTSVSTPVSSAALTDLGTAITYFGGLTAAAITTADLGTQGNGANAHTFIAGVYKSPSSINIATSIVLDAQDNPNAMFVFIATASTVTQASGTSITLVNGAQAANVVWVVGSSWTSITPSTTVGNILAVASITLGGGTLNGRALANAAITLAAAGTIVAAPPAALPTAQTFTPIFAGSPAVASEFLTGYNASTGLFSAAQVSYSQVLGTPNLSVYATQTFVTTQGYITSAGTATTISGSITESQVTGLVTDLAAKPKLYDQYGDLVGAAGSPPLSDNHIASGTATLAGGTSGTVTLTGNAAFSDASSYAVQVSYDGDVVATNLGHLWITYTDGANFVINSDNPADSSNVRWTAVGF
jgi:hypothetical protein